jgi:hypothetical protein
MSHGQRMRSSFQSWLLLPEFPVGRAPSLGPWYRLFQPDAGGCVGDVGSFAWLCHQNQIVNQNDNGVFNLNILLSDRNITSILSIYVIEKSAPTCIKASKTHWWRCCFREEGPCLDEIIYIYIYIIYSIYRTYTDIYIYTRVYIYIVEYSLDPQEHLPIKRQRGIGRNSWRRVPAWTLAVKWGAEVLR